MARNYTEITPGGYAYLPLRVGMILRAPEGEEVYFQPGDDTAILTDTIEALEEHEPRHREIISDIALSAYFD